MSISQVNIYPATPTMDKIIAEHFYQLWLDNHVEADLIRSDWLDVTLKFIQQARQELKFQAFVAQVHDNVVGSVSCQLFAGLYPSPFNPEYRLYGYIWNVYVHSDYRRQGIGTQLTKAAIDYLKKLKCTKAVLHASPYGKPVYENLGFIASNEMSLNLN
jgi:ribosomal protein S18 acetylase RimI-like enzyme